MKRLPIVTKSEAAAREENGGRVWYQTLAERDGDASIEEARVREFAEDRPFEPPPGVDRRTFMSLMGASMALGGLAGCRRPVEKILPFSHMPEGFVPGQSEHYATAMPIYGTAIGLLVESVDGRPIKIEGNPDHPETLGGTTAFVQAAILDLYDPDRSKGPKNKGQDATHDQAWAFLGELGKTLRGKKGKGLGILVGEHASPTTARTLATLQRDMPEAHIFRHECFSRFEERDGVAIALPDPRQPGVGLDVSYDLAEADVVVVLDSDLLGFEGNPVKNSKAYAQRRRPSHGRSPVQGGTRKGDDGGVERPMSRIYVAEPCPTVTGHAADHRLRIQARAIVDLGRELAAALAAKGVPVADGIGKSGNALGEKAQKWVAAAAADLAAAKGKSVVAVGHRQPAAVHALGAALNHALGNLGKTVRLPLMVDSYADGPVGLKALLTKLRSNELDTLLILGGNPLFDAPGDMVPALAEALKNEKLTSVHLSGHVDETSAACTWHIPRAHFLESWSDARSDGGTVSVIQPLIAPMYGGRTDAEVLDRLVGGTSTAHELVRNTWGVILPPRDFDRAFDKVVHDGFFTLPTEQRDAGPIMALNAAAVAQALNEHKAPVGEFEVVFAPDPHAYDGRFANNAWLQELPDPIHKGTWMTMAAVSHTTAKKLGVENGDLIEVTVAGKSATVPVVVSFGSADDSVKLPFGLGRAMKGSVCSGVGVNLQALRNGDGLGFAAATVKKVDGHEILAITQGHFIMEGRPLIRTQTVEEHKANPSWARDMVKHPPLLNLFKDWEYNGHKWGMAVDLSTCHGCSACITACQSENNIPVIGVAGVIKSREMHWLRIDRYFAGEHETITGADDADAAFMLMTCQHCENAPCEQVCPVAATTHSPEGLNEMTYNRCIGTKYCGNNCPYKVRRFNYFNYNKDIPETRKLGLNPEVTVRFRGVMEKCTFCVQRINEGKIQEKIALDRRATKEEAREHIRAIKTACQQACPTDAITFGDLNDPGDSADGKAPSQRNVRHLADSPRAYHMLEEINVRPRISYLARIRNPNSTLEPPKADAKAAAAPHGAAPQGKEGH